MQFADIVTERLVLRPLRPEDAEEVLAYRSLPEVSRYQCWEPKTVDEVRNFIIEMEKRGPGVPGSWFQLAITLGEGGALVGDLGIHTPADRDYEVEVGITVVPAHQRSGLGSEAFRGILRHLFETEKKHRVYGSVDPRNAASLRLLARVGFRREGYFVESLPFKGGWADDLIYAMLDREWAALNQAGSEPAPRVSGPS